MSGAPNTIYLLILVAKLETSHVLKSNKNNNYRGRCDHLSVSIAAEPGLITSKGRNINNC